MIAALPRPVQRRAQARALLVASLNPLGASITFGQVAFLLALFYGAGDTAMSLIYASASIAGLLALLAPWLLAGQDTSRVQARAWMVRGILSIGLVCLPLLASDAIKVGVLVAIIYLMMGARTIGVLAGASVTKTICPPRELPSFSAKSFSRWNIGVLMTTVLCFLALQPRSWGPQGEWTFMALMAFGAVFNIATAIAMAGMPCTGTIAPANPWRTLAAITVVWRRHECREMLWLTLLQMPIGLAAAFQLNYLTQVLGMAAGTVFLLTLGGVLASILATRILAVVGGRISTRALWFGMHALLAVAAIAWCAIEAVPMDARSGVCSVLWVLSAAALSGSAAIYGSMLSERLPADDATRVSVIYQLLGVLATVIGLVVLALAKHLVLAFPTTWIHPYAHAFALWAVLSIGVCLISLRLGGGKAAIDLISQLMPGNLSTIFRAHRLRTAEADLAPVRALELEEILAAGTPAGRDLVLETLRSPDPWHRAAALRAARSAPFPEATPPVLAEAADASSPLRLDAVTTLGFLGDRSVLPQLRSWRDAGDATLVATVSKSLARLGEPEDETVVRRRYDASVDPRERNELLIALAVAGSSAALRAILAAEIVRSASSSWIDSVALYAAQAHGGRETMRAILAAEDERPGSGVDEALVLVGERLGAAEAERLRQNSARLVPAPERSVEGLPVRDRRHLAMALTLRVLEAQPAS